MRFHAVAVDFDGTLAHDAVVEDDALEALRTLRKSGRRPILATGRIVGQLAEVFEHLDLFDAVVAENGAVLYDPPSGRITRLVDPPPAAFADRLRAAGVEPLERGEVIVATRQPHEREMLELVRELGLDVALTFNKGAVMALPGGVTKASGLVRQLQQFGISPHNLAGIGDAENDLGFLSLCEASAAVANALPSVKAACDIVCSGSHGRGVAEFIERIVADDLESEPAVDRRHRLALGKSGETTIDVPASCSGILVAGISGGGKSSFTSGFIESVGAAEYQYCVIDPEGDFTELESAIPVGSATDEPNLETVVDVLGNGDNTVISLVGIKLEDRPAFARRLLAAVTSVRERFGRPHWIFIDEAHHCFPAEAKPSGEAYRASLGTLLVTTQPKLVSREALSCVSVVVAVGDRALRTIEETRRQIEPEAQDASPRGPSGVPRGRALVWRREEPDATIEIEAIAGKLERRRHARKYAKGELAEEKSFYFTGPQRKLNLRAQNLFTFVQIGEGVDDETWTHHLQRHDFSHWVHEAIGDEDLETEFRRIEDERRLEPQESRRRIADAVRKRYTAPA